MDDRTGARLGETGRHRKGTAIAAVSYEASSNSVDAHDIPYVELAEGIEIKLLRVGGPTGTYTLIARFAPGVRLPTHHHFGEVHGYTIQGRWHYLEYDWVADSESFVYEPPGSTHTLEVFDDNDEVTIIFFVIDKGMVLFDDNGDMFLIEDAQSMFDMYSGALEARGVDVPTDKILP